MDKILLYADRLKRHNINGDGLWQLRPAVVLTPSQMTDLMDDPRLKYHVEPFGFTPKRVHGVYVFEEPER